MQNNYEGEPIAIIRHLRQVDDAGSKHMESIVTGRWLGENEASGLIKLEGNIRPDWQNNRMTAKTRRKVFRWTEELLQNNAVMGNLSVRLDPTKTEFEIEQDEEGDWTLTIWSGHLDTGVDSQSRLTAILRAARSDVGTFNAGTTFAVRIWFADNDLAARVGSDYNTRGDKVNDTAAKFAYQDNEEKVLARRLLAESPHLGIDNIEVQTNTVSASSSKLVAFNTLTQAMESYWRGNPITEAAMQEQTAFLVQYWDALVAMRPEFGRLGKSDRQALRQTSMAGTALSIHGVIAVAWDIYSQRLDAQKVLNALGEPVWVDGKAVDYFSYENPTWRNIGALVPNVDTSGHERLGLRMSFQTRKAVADELRRRVAVMEPVAG